MMDRVKETLVSASREVFYNQKFVVLLWATNSAMALIMTIPLADMLFDNLHSSLMSDRLALGFDFIWFTQFKELYKLGINQLPNLLYGVVIIYILMNAFFSGGLIAVFNNPNKNHIIDFFYGGVRHWYRFVKIVLVSVVLYAAAFAVNLLWGDLIGYAFAGTEYAAWDFFLRMLRYAFLIFMIGLVSIISDYTKIIMALGNRNDLFRAISEAALLIKTSFSRIFGVFFIVALLGGLGSLFYNIIDLAIPRTPYYFLIFSFILQQILVIFRLNIRMLFYATEVTIYKDIIADFVGSAEVVETE